MQFERDPDNPNKAAVRLTLEERTILNRALFRRVMSAASEGGEQFKPGELVSMLAGRILDPATNNYRPILINHAKTETLNAFAGVVAEDSEEIPYEQAALVGGFIKELQVAAKILAGQPTLEAHELSTEAIDQIVAEIEIPDYPEDLGN